MPAPPRVVRSGRLSPGSSVQAAKHPNEEQNRNWYTQKPKQCVTHSINLPIFKSHLLGKNQEILHRFHDASSKIFGTPLRTARLIRR